MGQVELERDVLTPFMMTVGRAIDDCLLEMRDGEYSSLTSKERYKNISMMIGGSSQYVRSVCQMLKKIMYIKYGEKLVLGDGKVGDADRIIDCVIDAARVDCEADSSMSFYDILKEAAFCVKDGSLGMHVTRRIDHKYRDFGVSIRHLRNLGLRFHVKGCGIYFDHSTSEGVNKKIESLCVRIGGLNIIHEATKELSHLIQKGTGRYSINRRVSMGVSVAERDVPWGWMVALGMKNLRYSGNKIGSVKVKKDYEKLKEILKSVVSIYEIQKYSGFEDIHILPSEIINNLGDGFLWDCLVGIPQCPPKIAREFLEEIFDALPDKLLEGVRISKAELVEVCKRIVDVSCYKVRRLTFEELSRGFGERRGEVEEFLLSFFVCEGGANNNLIFPPLNGSVDYYFKPIFRDGDGGLFVLPSPITSMACITAALGLISFPGGVFNSKNDTCLGMAFEVAMRSMIGKRGFLVSHGDYKGSLGEGECDAVVETEKTIIFLEMKKKGLTRNSMEGNQVSILTDMNAAVFKPQIQCLKAIQNMSVDGDLVLNDGAASYTIKGGGKRVLSVSLTMQEMGFIQDSFNSFQLLKAASMVKVGPIIGFEKTGRQFNEYADCLREYDQSFLGGEEDSRGELFLNSLLMSSFHLLYLLDCCDNNDELDSLIGRVCHVTTRVADTYMEINNLKRG